MEGRMERGSFEVRGLRLGIACGGFLPSWVLHVEAAGEEASTYRISNY